MKEFASRHSRLTKMPLASRLTYSIFLVFTLLALGVSFWLAHEMVGLNFSRFDAYYPGIEAQPTSAVAETGGSQAATTGPNLDLPDDLAEPAPPESKSLRSTLEVTHFHLFTMPLYLMVLSHLFLMTALSDRFKFTMVTLGALAVAGHLLAPWFARSGGGLSKLYYAASGLGLAGVFLVLTLVPLFEMWGKRSAAEGQRPSD